MRLGHFDLNLFITLDALLETASVSRAAERLHLGASATSSALGRLRAHFQDELLVPAGRGMHLTPLAQSLREPVRELLLRAQATLVSGSAVEPAALRRRFVINASDYATTVLLTPLSQRLEALAPGVSIDVVSLGNSNVERLERGDVDLAIYPERNASPDHPQCELLTERYSCVVWTGFHLQGEALGLPQYLAARHVAAQFGDLRVPTFESWFLATHQAQREVVASASSFNALPLLVVGTQRIATMHTRLARMYARLLPVRLLAPPFEIPPLTLVAQWNRLKAQDAALAWLREQLQAVALQA